MDGVSGNQDDSNIFEMEPSTTAELLLAAVENAGLDASFKPAAVRSQLPEFKAKYTCQQVASKTSPPYEKRVVDLEIGDLGENSLHPTSEHNPSQHQALSKTSHPRTRQELNQRCIDLTNRYIAYTKMLERLKTLQEDCADGMAQFDRLHTTKELKWTRKELLALMESQKVLIPGA